MSPKELKKFKEAIAKIDREYNTPEKARVDLPPNLRQPVKTRFSPNGELSHGYFA